MNADSVETGGWDDVKSPVRFSRTWFGLARILMSGSRVQDTDFVSTVGASTFLTEASLPQTATGITNSLEAISTSPTSAGIICPVASLSTLTSPSTLTVSTSFAVTFTTPTSVFTLTASVSTSTTSAHTSPTAASTSLTAASTSPTAVSTSSKAASYSPAAASNITLVASTSSTADFTSPTAASYTQTAAFSSKVEAFTSPTAASNPPLRVSNTSTAASISQTESDRKQAKVTGTSPSDVAAALSRLELAWMTPTLRSAALLTLTSLQLNQALVDNLLTQPSQIIGCVVSVLNNYREKGGSFERSILRAVFNFFNRLLSFPTPSFKTRQNLTSLALRLNQRAILGQQSLLQGLLMLLHPRKQYKESNLTRQLSLQLSQLAEPLLGRTYLPRENTRYTRQRIMAGLELISCEMVDMMVSRHRLVSLYAGSETNSLTDLLLRQDHSRELCGVSYPVLGRDELVLQREEMDQLRRVVVVRILPTSDILLYMGESWRDDLQRISSLAWSQYQRGRDVDISLMKAGCLCLVPWHRFATYDNQPVLPFQAARGIVASTGDRMVRMYLPDYGIYATMSASLLRTCSCELLITEPPPLQVCRLQGVSSCLDLVSELSVTCRLLLLARVSTPASLLTFATLRTITHLASLPHIILRGEALLMLHHLVMDPGCLAILNGKCAAVSGAPVSIAVVCTDVLALLHQVEVRSESKQLGLCLEILVHVLTTVKSEQAAAFLHPDTRRIIQQVHRAAGTKVNSHLVDVLLGLPEVGSRYRAPVRLRQHFTFSSHRKQQQQQEQSIRSFPLKKSCKRSSRLGVSGLQPIAGQKKSVRKKNSSSQSAASMPGSFVLKESLNSGKPSKSTVESPVSRLINTAGSIQSGKETGAERSAIFLLQKFLNIFETGPTNDTPSSDLDPEMNRVNRSCRVADSSPATRKGDVAKSGLVGLEFAGNSALVTEKVGRLPGGLASNKEDVLKLVSCQISLKEDVVVLLGESPRSRNIAGGRTASKCEGKSSSSAPIPILANSSQLFENYVRCDQALLTDSKDANEDSRRVNKPVTGGGGEHPLSYFSFLNVRPGLKVEVHERLKPSMRFAWSLASCLCSFLNTSGGTVYLGVKGECRVVGVQCNRKRVDELLQLVDRTVGQLLMPRLYPHMLDLDFIPVICPNRSDCFLVKISVQYGGGQEYCVCGVPGEERAVYRRRNIPPFIYKTSTSK